MNLDRFLPSVLCRDTLIRRLLLVYAAAIVVAVISGAAVISLAVWPHYEALERRESEHRLHAALQAIQSEQDRLQELVNTNAVWDDAFTFALGQDPTFPDTNFSEAALSQIGVDAVLVLGNDRSTLYQGGQGDFAPLLEAVARASLSAPALQLSAAQESHTELLKFGSEVALVSERRIVRADGSGPSPGILIFARRMGPDVLSRMRALTGTDFLISTVEHRESAQISEARAVAALRDAYGRKEIHVAVLGAHEVLAVGKTTILTLVAAAVVVLTLLAVAFAGAFIYAVIAPVSSLRRAVALAAETQTPCKVRAGAPSEIQSLAAAFDNALQTAKSQTEQRNAALAEKLAAEKANEAKSQFVATISHELRTPLNAIIGYGEIMNENAIDDGRQQDAEDSARILRAAQGLLSLINGILDLSKLGAGKMEVEVTDFEVRELLHTVNEIAMPLASAKGLKLRVVADDLGQMRCDEQKLRQCLLNLISNAVKFSERGGVTLRAKRLSSDSVAYIQFEVSDTGIGIEADALQHIFKPFSQADGSITRRFGGTGLGLAITRDFVRLLGGRIGVKSKPGVGTAFVIRMPVEFSGGARAVAETARSAA